MNTPALMLDLLALQDPLNHERGVPRYVASHAKALLGETGRVKGLLLNPMAAAPVRLDAALASSPLLRWNSAAAMRAAIAEGPAAYHIMSPLIDHGEGICQPRIPACVPIIVTLYDLIPLLDETRYLHSPASRRRYMNAIEMVRRADLVLTISEFTRRDAIRLLGIAPERAVTIGAGVDERFKPAADDADINREPFEHFGLRGRYVLAVLANDARKNLSGLIEAMTLLRKPGLRDMALVVVGKYDAESQERLRRTPGGQHLGGRLVFAGAIPDTWMISLYQKAAVHVFPSYQEGFGLPAAEAAACGCPSITSNTTSLPEVLDMPEATFPPDRPGEMAGLISRVLEDDSFRKGLVERGLRAARQHTWSSVARRTIEAVEQATPFMLRRTRLAPPAKPRIAFVGPFPPAQDRAADYNERICCELQSRCRLDVFLSSEQPEIPMALDRCRCLQFSSLFNMANPASYDAIIHAPGESSHPDEMYKLSSKIPGWIWLHDPGMSRLPSSIPEAVGVVVHSAEARDKVLRLLSGQSRVPPIHVMPVLFPDACDDDEGSQAGVGVARQNPAADLVDQLLEAMGW